MATRSRSPVISIQTRPDQEYTLRAEIEAANRTQHEILPRLSWHSALRKRDYDSSSKRNYKPVTRKDLPSHQSLVPATRDVNIANTLAAIDTFFDDGLSSHSKPLVRSSHRPWTKLGRRKVKTSVDDAPRLQDFSTGRQGEATGSVYNAGIYDGAPGQRFDNVQQPYNVQYLQWSEDKPEAKPTIVNSGSVPAMKPKWMLRKSLSGSIRSTKSLLQNKSKSTMRLTSAASPIPVNSSGQFFDLSEAPHIDSTIVSPSSSFVPGSQVLNIPQGSEPIELSAGPVPVELEDNSQSHGTLAQNDVSRISTPSIRDLPPYIEDGKLTFGTADLHGINRSVATIQPQITSIPSMPDGNCSQPIPVVEHHQCTRHSEQIRDVSGNNTYSVSRDMEEQVTCCASGRHNLSREGHDSNLIDAIRALSIGHDQAGQAVRGLHKSCARTNYDIHHMPSYRDSSACSGISSQRNNNDQPSRNTDASTLRISLLQDLDAIRREQDLVFRERELSLRAREIEIRDQATTLREREAMVQEKNDALVRNLATIVSYQELSRGVSMHGQQRVPKYSNSTDYFSRNDPFPQKARHPGAIERKSSLTSRTAREDSPDDDNKCQEAPMPQHEDKNAYIKSCVAQKRKKEYLGTPPKSNSSAGSSPQQSRKTLSRGNSERDKSNDEEDEDDEKRRPKKTRQESTTPNGPQLLFACPYSKYDPFRYSSRNVREKNYRGCDGHFLTDVSRLKQHLKRVHWQPEAYCHRCFEEFENSRSLSDHAQSTVACLARECPFPEKMDKTKQDKIHVKRPRVAPRAVWYDIYKVLFPGAQLPDSPYVDRDERVLTPISAIPQSDAVTQAGQHLASLFQERLNRHEELENHHLQPLMQQALNESFTEFLRLYSVSPTPSPITGPSLIVSPVSRTSSATAERPGNPQDGLPAPSIQRSRSITTVVSQPQSVPVLQQPCLQQPRPPRLHLRTALAGPKEDREYRPSHMQVDPSSCTESMNANFNVNIPVHVQEDQGYDNECHSFERGDDQKAMAFVDSPDPPGWRNKSVLSLDSGYGSHRSQQISDLTRSTSALVEQAALDKMEVASLASKAGNLQWASNDISHPQQNFSASFNGLGPAETGQIGLSNVDFQSYSQYLDPMLQYEFNGIDYSLEDANNNIF